MNHPLGFNRPKVVDLFAGAGGLSLGFEQAGFDVAAAVEIDPIHCAAHEFNFPYSKVICASVVDLTGDQIRRKARLVGIDLDVVVGGAPCQGFSMIGKRALDDPRNQLVSEYVRIVRELAPKYCVFENVRGLTLGKHAQFLNELIETVGAAGYRVLLPYKVLNSAQFGVPQDRRRLFLMAARNDMNLPAYPESAGVPVSVWDAIGDLPNADHFEQLLGFDSVRARWSTLSEYARRLRGALTDKDDFSHPRANDQDVLTSSMRTIHTPLSMQRFMGTAPGETEAVSRFRKLDPAGLCNTLRAGTDSARGAFTSPRPIHPNLPRVITVREAARLHSYPDWFRFHMTKWHGFRQIGNSVPPLLGRAVGHEIMKALNLAPVKPTTVMQLGHIDLLTYDMGAAARHFRVSRDVIAQRTRNLPQIQQCDNQELLYA